MAPNNAENAVAKLIIAPLAVVDLDEIWLYIAADSVKAADGVIDGMNEECHLIADNPGMGREREDLAPGLRSYPYGNYLIVYRESDDGVEIARVVHGSRNLKRLF
jgi:toxin ParE1/3/4